MEAGLHRANIEQSKIKLSTPKSTCGFIFQMELDRSADPPPALWVATTKSSVNKWVSDTSYTL